MELFVVFFIKLRVFVIFFDFFFVNIILKFVVKSWRVYVFIFEVLDCDVRKLLLIIRIYVFWFNEDVYRFLSNGVVEFVLKLYYFKLIGSK